MHDDLFEPIEPPPHAIERLRATLRRRAQARRRRRAVAGAAVVLAAVLATLRSSGESTDVPRTATIVAFDTALHPALAVVDDLAPVTPRGASSPLLRRPTRDDDVVLYELGP